MGPPLKEGTLRAGAIALALPAFLCPVYNPDLFWHLSAGRWILAHRAVPHSDWLSFTRAGAPWLDFEWLSQLIFELSYRVGGLAALWALKGLLLLAAWLCLDSALRLHRLSGASRAAGLLLWSIGALAYADIRPELFSVVLCAALLRLLESLRARKAEPSAGLFAAAAAGFALWSNLHAGFIMGLALITLYALAGVRPKTLSALFAAAAAGALVNPFGWGPYLVAWRHLRESPSLTLYIAEWHGLSTINPVYWPVWLLLALLAPAVIALGRRRAHAAPLLAAGAFGLAALGHERTTAYFNTPAVLALLLAAREEGELGRRLLLGAAAGCGAFALWLAPRFYWRGTFNPKFVPRTAAEFMARQRPALEPLRVYNPWEWGGYLGWRLAPWHKVFDDGRYIFHEDLPREAEAVRDPQSWAAFLDAEKLDAALMQNTPMPLRTTRAYPDGSTKQFERPYYVEYMPRARWALVHWDERALVFVRRGAAPADWVAAHEYRFVRPNDGPAFEDALSRGELPKGEVAAEALRHQSELRELTEGK